MSEPTGIEILQSEIEKSKGRLKGFNENIKKLTGHENPGPQRGGRRNFGSERQEYDDKFSGRMGRGRGRLFGMAKRGLMEDSGPPVKRRLIGGAFSRLGPAPIQRRVREESPEEEDLPIKPSVHSSVVATSREAKNRQDVMQEQNNDKEGMQRNRRMFGLLLGTLNKFKTDSKTLESKAEQRKRIDQKLEENAEKERKKFKQETMELMEERHLEQSRISRLEQKMEVVQEHADIEKEMKKLKNFLCTKARPRIFWLPRQMNTAAQNKLKDSVKVVDDMLKSSQGRLEKEIKEVMERETKREERIKMRLREDGLFLDNDAKEKENDEIKKEKDTDGSSRVDKQVEEQKTDERLGKKLKIKRRIVVEERISRGSDGEIVDDDEEEEEERQKEISVKITRSNVEESKKTLTLIRRVKRSDDEGSESEDEADSKNNTTQSAPIISRKDASPSAGNKKDKGEDDEDEDNDDGAENSRVVLYREKSNDRSSADKEERSKGKKDKDDDDKGEERREHKSHSDKHKHSHRRSKHSRKDSERSVGKEGDDDKDENKKKRKSSESERAVEGKGEDVKKELGKAVVESDNSD